MLRSWPALGAAILAVLAGCALLTLSGAPLRMPLMNLAALLVGLCLLMIMAVFRRAGAGRRFGDGAVVAAAAIVPLTALLGPDTQGVARWLVIAGISVQPAMMIVPVVALAFAGRPNRPRLAAVSVAALGTALQPDPGAAAMLWVATGAALLSLRPPIALTGFACATAALATALLVAAPLPPADFVENRLPDALADGPLTAAIALAAVVLLLAPASMVGTLRRKPVALAFAGTWAGALLASLVGSFPTPLLGYGGSAVVGYILGVGLLVRIRLRPSATKATLATGDRPDTVQGLRFAR